MDYDDNDFQSQNFQLIGEDNNKFPSGLRSFSLPKFDLDEHLEVHLRFDSLVEPDVLLGIQGQEESNWIEGFSAGSSAIEFSSSAAETCSISKHNNVWSEATSSESVEMLLKSVGEDEMINKQIEESNVHDGLDSLNHHMDPSSTQDNSLHFKLRGAINTDPALPPDKCQRNLAGLDSDVIGVLPHVEGTPQTSKDGKCGSGSLIVLDGSSSGEKLNSYGKIISAECGSNEKLSPPSDNTFRSDATKGQSLVDENCIDVVQNDNTLEGEFLDDHASGASGLTKGVSDSNPLRNMQVEPSATVISNLGNQKIAEQVPEGYEEDVLHAKPESFQTDIDQKEESKSLHKGNEFNDQSSEGHAVESSLGTTENPSSIDPKADTQVFNESDHSGKPDVFIDEVADKMKSKGGEVGDQILARAQETALNMDSLVQGIEGFSDVGIHEKPEGLLKDDGIPVESTVSIETTGVVDNYGGRECELSMVIMEEKQDTESHLIESNNDGVASPSSSAAKVCNLTNITREPRVIEIKEDDGSVGIHLRNFTSNNTDSAAMEKSSEDEILDSDVRSSEGSLNAAQEVKLENSGLVTKGYSPASPANDEQVTGVKKDGDDLDIHLPDISFPAVKEMTAEDVIVKSGARNEGWLSAIEKVMPENSHSINSNDLDGVEVHISSSMNVRSWEMCHKGALEPDSCGSHMIPSEVSVLEEECKKSSINSDNTGSHSDVSCVMEKTQDASLQVQNTATPPSDVNDSPAKEIIQDDPEEAVLQKEVMETNLTTSVSIHLDRNEESFSRITREPCLSNPMGNSSSLTASGLDSFSDPGQHNLSSPVGLQSTMVVQAASSMEKSVQITYQKSAELEAHPVAYSVAKEKAESEEVGVPSEKYEGTVLNISGKITSNDEVMVNKQQDSKANLALGDDCGRKNLLAQTETDAVNCNENYTPSVTLSKSNAESLSLEPESGNHSSIETNCGSPTVISSSEHSHGETVHREGNKSSDRIVAVSGYKPLISSKTISSKTDKNFCEDKSVAYDSKENNASEDDRNFTFEVGSLPDLSERDTGSGWKPFPSIPSFVLPQTGEGTSTTSILYQSDLKVSKETSHGSHLVSGGGVSHGVRTKNADKDKSRSASGSGTQRVSASKRKPAKETLISKQTLEKGGNPCSISANTVGVISRDMELEEMRQYSYVEGSSMKPSCATTVQTSNLPDLNTAAALFHQPFTDSQQVQLRAQIFVYGSLIQGIPPDEACMISAFGDTDGGRSIWEGVWRVATERFHIQKSTDSNCETPLHARSGVKIFEQVSRCNPFNSKALNTPTSRTGNKGAPSAIFNSTMPTPSPVWSVSTPRDILHANMARGLNLDSNQVLSPLHAYQSSPIRQYAGNGTPWPAQAPCPAPWFASTQASALGTGTQFSALPIAETVQVTPIRDSSLPRGSNLQLVSPSVFPAAGGPVSISAASAMQTETKRKTTSTGPDKNASADQKSRKRKKGMMPQALGQVLPVSQTDLGSAAGGTKHLPTSVGLHSPANLSSKVTSSGLVSTLSPIMSPTHFQIISTGGSEQKVIFSEETCSKIEQAKQQADDAAAFAASAFRHRDGIWTQLAIQKNSGLVSDCEAKLVSAAVAAAAAASVAKAAAAAAKVASDAALQAKMMADEAIILTKMGNSVESSETGYPDGGNNLGRVSPVSLLTGKDKTNGSSSIISAAREAARRRLEAASAATKRAENLDAIVKAAELAAEAVSQAGAIIAMGEPLSFSLNDLVEAGPEGYWKVQRSTSEQLGKTNGSYGVCREEQLSLDSAKGLDRSVKYFNQQPSNQNEIQKTTDEGGKSSASLLSRQTMENHTGEGSGLASCAVPTEGYEKDQLMVNPKENIIQEGSLVEVLSEEDGLRGVWFSACVLSLKDDQACVCYNELPRDKGSGKLKEWIPLEGKGDKAPRIRIAHPITAAKPEGTRKRRRAAVGNYVWAVGDQVDAWIRDGWWEGIVMEKSKEDETKLTVHFPARGDSSIVRTWDLRPSLIWKDGQWVEWSRLRETSFQPHEGDTPQEKRQKLGRLEVINDSEVDGIVGDKLSRNLHIEDPRKPAESRLFLSAKDKIFSVGKSVRENNKSDSLRIKRTGLQKEGSRVIFGVPKPGKKKKFMEVSKHYVADKTSDKISEGSDSLKFAKYLMPQTSRGWKNTSKIDPKCKQVGDSKPKVLKSVKSQTRSTTERESSSISVVSASSGGGSSQVSLPNFRASHNHEENKLEKNLLEVGSFSESHKTAEGPTLVSQQLPVPGVPSSKKKSASAVETELWSKGKTTFVKEKSAKNEEKGSSLADNTAKTTSDAIEPRRSNRRIQPTSRLLEGLQSSLIIAKIPNVSHDKSSKVSHRSVSSRGNAHG